MVAAATVEEAEVAVGAAAALAARPTAVQTAEVEASAVEEGEEGARAVTVALAAVTTAPAAGTGAAQEAVEEEDTEAVQAAHREDTEMAQVEVGLTGMMRKVVIDQPVRGPGVPERTPADRMVEGKGPIVGMKGRGGSKRQIFHP